MQSESQLHQPAQSNFVDENYRVLNRIIDLVAKQLPLVDCLEQCIDILLSLSWLSLLPKAGIFLTKTDANGEPVLYLVAERNIGEPIRTLCSKVAFGHCLCGQAALSRQAVHASCIDHRHETTFDGIAPHGHYNIPILSDGNVLGVMVFYLPDGTPRNVEGVSFLEHVASTLAMVITINRQTADLSDRIIELNYQKQALDQHAIVSTTSVDGTILYANGKFCAASGYSTGELLGRNHRILRSGEHNESFFVEIQECITSGQIWKGEIKSRRKDGGFFWAATTIVPLLDRSGQPFQCVVLQTDISELKRQEQNLSEKEHRFRLFAESVDEGIMVSENMVIQDVSSVWAEMFRCKPENAIGLTLLDFTAEHLRDQVSARVTEGETDTIESVMQRLDGTTFPALVRARFHSSNGRIVRYSTVLDISKQKQHEAELTAAVAAAEKANQAKAEFLSSMSHELRTPLNSIIGFAQMLAFSPLEPLTEGQKNSVDMILDGGQHLLELINDVLDLAKIESGTMTVKIEVVSLPEVMNTCISMMRALAEKRNISLKISDSNCIPQHVCADRIRLKQVILNLISNAIKYNEDNGSIDISMIPQRDDMMRITVEDTGKGLVKEDVERLFQPFERLDAEATEIEGTGIGLTISKKLMSLMKGTIGVDSEVNVGSRFWIELPIANVDNRTAIAQSRPSLPASCQPASQPKMSGTMLYVEDNSNNQKLMELIVSHINGVELISAPTGRLGLEMALAHPVELIILDVNLPDMNGHELVAELRKDTRLQNIPIFALTAASSDTAETAALNAGFDRYLAKPINVGELMTAVIEVMQVE